jgi:hypothetical protein
MELFFQKNFLKIDKQGFLYKQQKFFNSSFFYCIDFGFYFFIGIILSCISLIISAIFIGFYSFLIPIVFLVILPTYYSFFSSEKMSNKIESDKINQKIKIIRLSNDFTIQKIKSYLDFLNISYDNQELKFFLISINKQNLNFDDKKKLISYITRLESKVENQIFISQREKEEKLDEIEYQNKMNQYFQEKNTTNNHEKEQEFNFFHE